MKLWKSFCIWRDTNVGGPPDDKLELAEEACEYLAVTFGIVVFAGLLLEVIEALLHLQTYPFVERWGAVLADVPVAAGVFGEVYFSAKGGKYSSELRRRSNIKLSEATEKAAEANRQAADAQERTAEIQKLTAWRHITPEQLAKVKDLLRGRVAALDLLIDYERGDPEAYAYAREIARTFQIVSPLRIRFGVNNFLGASNFGLYLGFAPAFDGRPIVQAFDAADIPVTISSERDLAGVLWGTEPPNFHIFVGSRPPPPLVPVDCA